MPVQIALQALLEGFGSIPYFWTVAKVAPWLALLYVLKVFFGGARSTAERNMHSKVVVITGGTTGVGAAVAYALASRGAQLVLLTREPLTDPFLEDYILDLRARTANELITAEQVDLASLHSIRRFATKWVDNAPPRRLDMLVLCGATATPPGGHVRVSEEGVEACFAVNYLANFQLLSILSPALRAQPPDRDVRVLFATCSAYMGGRLPEAVPRPKLPSAGSQGETPATSPAAAYGSSKLALMTFAAAFQKHLSAYQRPDKQPMNARVVMVDPGWCRTAGMRRYLTFGSLWGLLIYLIMWPLWWLVLKSPEQGAQSFLHAAMEAEFGMGEGGWLLKECREIKVYRDEVKDEEKQRKLWEMSEKAVQALEQEQALARAAEKKEQEEAQRVEEKRKDGEIKAGSRRSRKAE